MFLTNRRLIENFENRKPLTIENNIFREYLTIKRLLFDWEQLQKTVFEFKAHNNGWFQLFLKNFNFLMI